MREAQIVLLEVDLSCSSKPADWANLRGICTCFGGGLPVNSSHGQLVAWSTRHRSTRHPVDSSRSRLVTKKRSTRHKQTNKQTSKPYCRSSNPRSPPLLKKCTGIWAENKVNNKAHAVFCSLHVQWAEQRVIVWICTVALPTRQRHCRPTRYAVWPLARRLSTSTNCRTRSGARTPGTWLATSCCRCWQIVNSVNQFLRTLDSFSIHTTLCYGKSQTTWRQCIISVAIVGVWRRGSTATCG